MSYPLSLTSLTPREAVTDALYRAINGFDRNDISILISAFVEDASFELHDGGNVRSVNGVSDLRTQVFDRVGPMDTMHMISNVRVDVKDGANTAFLTANALAQHCPPGRGKEPDGPKWLVGGEYSIDLVKDEEDGLWKVKKWVMKVIWRQGDPSVMGRPS